MFDAISGFPYQALSAWAWAWLQFSTRTDIFRLSHHNGLRHASSEANEQEHTEWGLGDTKLLICFLLLNVLFRLHLF